MNIHQCLKEMTHEEKILLLEGADKGFTNPVKRLGIPRILLADGPHGVRVEKGTDPEGDDPYLMTGEMEATTAFPCEAAMAATWNTDLIRDAGRCLGEEARANGVGVLLGPGVNGKRSPLGGRNFEYFSEDPVLSGMMAAAWIRGVQSQGVGACLKHFALNDQESRRTSVDVHVDERAMWEIYLKPFVIAIREADPWSVMASYNKVGGAYMCENKEMLQHVLRDRIGFGGAVISDWGAVHDKVRAVEAGLSLQMPGPSGDADRLIAAAEGRISEEEIDRRAAEVLRLVQRVSDSQSKEQNSGIPDEGSKDMALLSSEEHSPEICRVPVNWQEHHEISVQTAAEGMVLLKNTGDILPLRHGMRIAVIGELAAKPYYVGGGSSSLTPRQTDSPIECMAKGTGAVITYAPGYLGETTTVSLLEEACTAAASADVVLCFVGCSTSESLDRENILLPACQVRLIHEIAAASRQIVLITQCGSVIDYTQVEEEVRAILHVWIPGEGFGTALTDILFGRKSPSGKLAETFPLCLENTPAYQNFPGVRDDVYYSEGILTGYRYYDTKKFPVRYPFGFGLSYTTFAASNLRLSSHEMQNGDKLGVMVDIANTGDMEGKEVVQIYVHPCASSLFRPEKELQAFAKVDLIPGETTTVELELDEKAFACYYPHLGRFAVESGQYEILAGTSSRDIALKDRIRFISDDEVRPPLDRTDSFKDYLQDDRYAERAGQFLKAIHVDSSHMFYQMIMGVNLNQIKELLAIMGIEAAAAEEMISNLVG